jgi:hypothetical protein
MLIDPADIDFRRLTDSAFEEMCFDLLLRRGYEGLVWRRAGADSGRDIQGRLRISHTLVGPYDELWFVECKRFGRGVGPEELQTKIAWADAERPDHLLFFVSSHLTNGCREWLNKIRSQKPYRIHVVEGTLLTDLLLQHSDLLERYCLDRAGKLLLDMKRRWLIHDLLPDLEALALAADTMDTSRLTLDEAVFLWASAVVLRLEMDDVGDARPVTFEGLAQLLRVKANAASPVLKKYGDRDIVSLKAGCNPWSMVFTIEIGARLRAYGQGNTAYSVLYAFVRDSDGEGLEMCVAATGDFPTLVRHVEKDASREAGIQFAAIAESTRRDLTTRCTRRRPVKP